jgi:ketosteroid isomerase-like protein
VSSPREVVTSIYERWNRHKGDPALDLFHPKVEIHQMAKIFDSEGTFHGHEGVIRAGRELAEVWKEITWKPEEWIEASDRLVVPLTATGVASLSGIEADTKFTHVWRIEDGLVKELSVYETKKAALEACG